MNVLIVGSGGREHALGWKISQSPQCENLYFAPGNGGTSDYGVSLDIAADDIKSLVKFAKQNDIDITMVGPEVPLAGGIVDAFQYANLKVCGPVMAGAKLEGSKVFCKQVMKAAGVPTAAFEVFDDVAKAKAYVDKKGAPIVVKADGLAAGKGVVVASTKEEAYAAIDSMLGDKIFGEAGDQLVIEDCLVGEEASIIAFVDEDTVLPMVVSQDHKRIFDDDKGPNTGGMGAYAPAPMVDKDMLDLIKAKVFEPMRKEMQRRGIIFRGILYAGLMIDGDKLGVLEFNVRFGDPETQVILPKLKTDFIDLMLACASDDLKSVNLEWDDRFCMTVVLASAGYPASSSKGQVIEGIEEAEEDEDVMVFHAGTAMKNGELVTAGGRVLAVSALGEDFHQAKEKAYAAVNKIKFEGMQYRKDIGAKALKYL